jgi:formate hydrogenlyase subunit 3/multisubunit Na+/H+ antiporter MnhD subunit
MKKLSIVYALITGFLTVQAAEYALHQFDLKEMIAYGIVESVQSMPSVAPVTADAL